MFIIKDKNDIQLFKVYRLSKNLYKSNLNNIKISNIINNHMNIYKKNLNKNLYTSLKN